MPLGRTGCRGIGIYAFLLLDTRLVQTSIGIVQFTENKRKNNCRKNKKQELNIYVEPYKRHIFQLKNLNGLKGSELT